jgi:hypothetical protein
VRDGGVAAVAVVRVGVLGMRFVGRRLVDHQRSPSVTCSMASRASFAAWESLRA